MVVMGMGDEYGIDATKRLRKYLLPKVGATVNEYARGVGLYKNGAAQTLVARIGALAGGTRAAYNGHTTRGACSEKCYLHTIFTSG